MKIVNFFLKTILFYSLIFCLNSCGIKKFQNVMDDAMTTELVAKTYTQVEIQEDVDFYLKTMHEVCPFPYLNSDSLKIQAIASKIKNKEARDAKDVYLDFLELSSAFNTGHIYLGPPKQMIDSFFAEGGKVFPLALLKKKEKWIVTYSADSTQKDLVGKVITNINGQAIEGLIQSFKPYVSGENKEENIGRQITSFLWLKNINAPYKVTLVDTTTQETLYRSLEGYGIVAQVQYTKNEKKREELGNFITFEILSNNIAYIDFKSMSIFDKQLTKEFYIFLKETFAEIKAKNCKDLIIDLRENGGGRGMFASLLLSYITDKPYRQSAGETRRVSQQFKDFINEMPWLLRKIALKAGKLQDYPKLPNGTNRISFDEPKAPKKLKNRFQGKVWCLISGNTYSAAMMMANAIEDYDLGTLVGEATGGVPNELSDNLPTKTPHTKIAFMTPSVIFTRANGDASDPNPVLPDVEIKTSAEDFAQDKDPVMNYILSQIMSKK